MPFISFEGIDHCGKRTQMERIRVWLEEVTDRPVECFSEPNDKTPIGQHIRHILKGEVSFPGNLELQRMFALGQAQDWECFIKPALSLGAYVLLERYAHSTLAYSLASGLDLKKIHELQKTIIGSTFRWPDLTILLDISIEESLVRIEKAGRNREHFETKERITKARDAYVHLLELGFGRLMFVNGEQSVERVTGTITHLIIKELHLF